MSLDAKSYRLHDFDEERSRTKRSTKKARNLIFDAPNNNGKKKKKVNFAAFNIVHQFPFLSTNKLKKLIIELSIQSRTKIWMNTSVSASLTERFILLHSNFYHMSSIGTI